MKTQHNTTQHVLKLLGIVSFTAMLIFSMTACGPDPEELGSVTITSSDGEFLSGPFPVSTELIAVYDGDEKVTYQWFDSNGDNKQSAKDEKAGGNKYTPTEVGEYYVIVYFNDLDSRSDTFKVCVDFNKALGKWGDTQTDGGFDYTETITITNNSFEIKTSGQNHGEVLFKVTNWENATSIFNKTELDDGFSKESFSDGFKLTIVKETWDPKGSAVANGLTDKDFNMTNISIFFDKTTNTTSFARTGPDGVNAQGNPTISIVLREFEKKTE